LALATPTRPPVWASSISKSNTASLGGSAARADARLVNINIERGSALMIVTHGLRDDVPIKSRLASQDNSVLFQDQSSLFRRTARETP
jgi:hypothetical protein